MAKGHDGKFSGELWERFIKHVKGEQVMGNLDKYRQYAEYAKRASDKCESMEAGDAFRLALYAQAPLDRITELKSETVRLDTELELRNRAIVELEGRIEAVEPLPDKWRNAAERISTGGQIFDTCADELDKALEDDK